jgi:hypothetical protein
MHQDPSILFSYAYTLSLSLSRVFKPKLFSDQTAERIFNFWMAGDRGLFPVVGIHVNVVVRPMAF